MYRLNVFIVTTTFLISSHSVIGSISNLPTNSEQQSFDDHQNTDLISCDTETNSDYRLPRTATPVHYNITLRPDLNSLTFDGEVSISVTINESNLKTVTLHSVDLDVHDVTFFGESSKGESL